MIELAQDNVDDFGTIGGQIVADVWPNCVLAG
jgi:hypothetical protein